MNTIAERLLDPHLSGATIIERGYHTIPSDWFVDANDADGHVQSWTECFPGVRQKPVALRRGSVLGWAGQTGGMTHSWHRVAKVASQGGALRGRGTAGVSGQWSVTAAIG